MGFYIKKGWKCFQCILKAIKMFYNPPKHSLHSNVSDKETDSGHTRHNVHNWKSSQPTFKKWNRLSNLFGTIRRHEPPRDIWDKPQKKETINGSNAQKILHGPVLGTTQK